MASTSRKVRVASRKYRTNGQPIKATLYRPVRREESPRDWVAEFSIEGLPETIWGRAIGIDSLQAILLAAQALRQRLEALDVEFVWLEREPNDSGIPREIADNYGLAFSRYAEQLVVDATTRFINARRRKDE